VKPWCWRSLSWTCLRLTQPALLPAATNVLELHPSQSLQHLRPPHPSLRIGRANPIGQIACYEDRSYRVSPTRASQSVDSAWRRLRLTSSCAYPEQVTRDIQRRVRRALVHKPVIDTDDGSLGVCQVGRDFVNPDDGDDMWSLKNRTPYAANKTWGRDENGVHEWIVVVKGTYAVKGNGDLALADEQLQPLDLPDYYSADGLSSLRYEADLIASKPTTDVLLNGTAYAPQGKLATEFSVSIRLERIYKELKVVGNRTWKQSALGLSPSAAEPVRDVPIVYERAFGGFDQSNPDPKEQKMDTRNPVGCGLVATQGDPLPNFEYPGKDLQRAGPAGFGALASYWSPRRELQGTYDEAWRNSRYPLLPADWDPHSLLCSPVDQRPNNHLRGGERVELNNLTPTGRLTFTLPKVYLTFRTKLDNRHEEHRGQLAAVIIEPDFPRVIMVWHTSLKVRANVDYLDETLVREKPYN
jgi:hypothetical protein